MLNPHVFRDDKLNVIFEREGIVQIPLLNTDDLESLRALYESIPASHGDRSFHSTMFINDPAYRKLIDAALREFILPKIFGYLEGFEMLFANFIIKEPSANTAVAIHQDWNFCAPEHLSFNIWIPLVDINEQTGRFYALKGSHKIFNNIRYTPYENDRYDGVKEYVLSHSSAFTPLAGEALIYHGAVIHYSDSNISNNRRLAIGCVMVEKNVPLLHYYRPFPGDKRLEIYAVDPIFYNSFDIFNAPEGVDKVGEIDRYPGLPSFE